MDVLRYAGFAEETSFGQDPAPSAAFHVDIASATLDAPTETELVYAGGLGRGARTHRPGFYSPAGNVVYAFDVRTIAWLLKWALGGYTFTAGTAPNPNRHEIYASEATLLPSFVTRLGKDAFEHVVSGCVVNSLELAVEDQFAQATVDLMAARDAKAAVQPASGLLLPAEYPLAFHDLTVQLNGGDISAKVKSLTLSIANNAAADAGRTVGSRHPRRIRAGERQVTVSANLWYEGTAELERFWGGASGPAASGAQEFGLTFTLNGGQGGTIQIAAPRVIYTQVQQQPTGRDEIVQAVAMRAFTTPQTLADGTTQVRSELLVTVENQQGELVPA